MSRKAVVLLQIAAIVFLQLHALAPLFSRTFSAHAAAIRCVGDHKRCGCSPVKVSLQTCCCYQNGKLAELSTALTTDEHGHEDVQHGSSPLASHCALSTPASKHRSAVADADPADERQRQNGHCNTADVEKGATATEEQEPAWPVLSSSPCGGSPDYFFASLEKIKFLRQLIPANEPELSATVQHHHSNVFQGRIPEPPVPPPKVSTPA